MWIELTLHMGDDLPRWPGTHSCEIISNEESNGCTFSSMMLPLHYGTHIDAPRHFIPGGKTIDLFDIDELCGVMEIIETRESKCVNINHVENVSCPIVFFKTQKRLLPKFNPDYCYISPDAAHVLLQKNVRIVGTDYLSVENYADKEFTVHKLLLGNGVLLVEGLNLQRISQGEYEVMIIPLRIAAEASPVRVLAKPLSSP